jgi:hypothetical protein
MFLASPQRPFLIFGGLGFALLLATSPAAAGGAGGIGGSGGAAAGQAGQGGAAGTGEAGSAGASGFAQAVIPKAGGVLAGAGDPTATYAVTCADDLYGRCAQTSSIVFDKIQVPPGIGQLNLDTGWVPQGQPIAVKFALHIPASTHVHLETPFLVQWPDALTIQTPGTRKTGVLDFHYGLKTEAKVKVDTDFFGQDIYWEADVPYVPKIDFGVQGARTFDPWVWDGIRAEGSTDKITLFKLNVLELVTGIPSQIGAAGLSLDVWGEMGVTYRTERIAITPSEGPITKEDISAYHAWDQGAWAEYKFHPEGSVDYDGTIHIAPSFYVSALGKTFSIPIYDYEYPIDLPTTPFVFDDQLVHVPLPNIQMPEKGAVIDIGKVTVGEYSVFQVAFPNVGEAPLLGTMYLEDPAVFQVLSKNATGEPGQAMVVKLGYQPTTAGPFTTRLLVASNDPDSPYVVVTLKGESEGIPDDPTNTAGAGGRPDPGDPEPGDPEPTAGNGGAAGSKTRFTAEPDTSSQEGGCACGVMPLSNASSSTRAGLSVFALAGIFALRSRARKSKSAVPSARKTAR